MDLLKGCRLRGALGLFLEGGLAASLALPPWPRPRRLAEELPLGLAHPPDPLPVGSTHRDTVVQRARELHLLAPRLG